MNRNNPTIYSLYVDFGDSHIFLSGDSVNGFHNPSGYFKLENPLNNHKINMGTTAQGNDCKLTWKKTKPMKKKI